MAHNQAYWYNFSTKSTLGDKIQGVPIIFDSDSLTKPCKKTCKKIDLNDPCIKYDPYFNLYNDLYEAGRVGNRPGPCCNEYCSYYRKPWVKSKKCHCPSILPDHSCCPDKNRCFHNPLINFSKFLVQYLVTSPPIRSISSDPSCQKNICYPCGDDPTFENSLFSRGLGVPKTVDPHLINPSDLVIVGSTIWVANTASGTISSYDLNGKILPTLINVIGPTLTKASPMAIIYNPGPGFLIPNTTEPAYLIVATREGTINGYNPTINSSVAAVIVNRSDVGALYTSLTNTSTHIFATDFANARVDVFDTNFKLVSNFSFNDPTVTIESITVCPTGGPSTFKQSIVTPMIPGNFFPYSISFVNNQFYVFYARIDTSNPGFPLNGFGHGFINIFDRSGGFVGRLLSRGALNTPSNIVFAPTSFGFPTGSYLIINTGNGFINVYNSSNILIGRITDICGNYVRINGLRQVAVSPFFPNTIYFVAAPDNSSGILGAISLSPYPC